MLSLLTPENLDLETLRALNNAQGRDLPFADQARFKHLVGQAFFAATMNGTEAFILAFDQDADYDSPHFLWFKAHFPRFIYIDRVVTEPAARGQGHAGRLYDELFKRARAAGHTRAVCEINGDPPNPASAGFHAKFRFQQVGPADLSAPGNVVHYYAKVL